jgi:sortase A
VKIKIVMRENPIRRVVRLILLVVGIAGIGLYCEAWLYRIAYQAYENWQFDHQKAESPQPPRPTKRAALPASLPDPDRGVTKDPVTGTGWVVGRISIPRLNISAMVEEGVDATTLARAVGHIPGTALPGETGNIGIAGHRDTFFEKLKDLKPHDQIDFTTHGGLYHYTVDSLTIVDPSDVSVLEARGGKKLTIVTCFPFRYVGNAPRRFIVHATAD